MIKNANPTVIYRHATLAIMTFIVLRETEAQLEAGMYTIELKT